MAHWVSATRQNGNEVMINLDAAYMISRRSDGGSVIAFMAGSAGPGWEESFKESAAQLLTKEPLGSF